MKKNYSLNELLASNNLFYKRIIKQVNKNDMDVADGLNIKEIEDVHKKAIENAQKDENLCLGPKLK